MKPRLGLIGLLLTCLALPGCKESYASKEVKSLESRFDKYASDARLRSWQAFAHECGSKTITKLLIVGDEQSGRTRLIVHVANRSGAVYLHQGQIEWGENFKPSNDDTEFTKMDLEDLENQIIDAYRELRDLGLQGFSQLGDDHGVKVYLELNICLLVLSSESSQRVRDFNDQYSTAGRDPRGDAVRKISDLVYIQTERR